MRSEDVKQLIEQGLNTVLTEVQGDDGRHFNATVISSDFAQKNRVQRHALVYATLQPHLQDGSLHAISIQTYTPEEWRNKTSD